MLLVCGKTIPKLAAAGCAVLQASFLAWTETSLLKAFTGRKNPDNFIYKKTNDASKKFQFGFLNNGIHYGWPSGHMAVSTALLTSLASFYLDNSYIQAISWIAWFYMFYGVTVHEGNTMHWFSDIVAGSLMGFTIGSSVGKNYRKSFQKIKESSNWQYNAFINTNNIGLKLSFQF